MRGGIVMSTAGTVPAVSRWYRAMSWMLIGHLFTTITFDVLGLDLILPAIAGVFQALGLRALRRENRWFARAYPCMVLLAVHRLFWLLAGFTIWYGFLSELPVIHVLSWAVLVLRGVVLFLLWKGVGEAVAFRCVLNKADTPERLRGAEEIAALLAAQGVPSVITAYSEEEQGGLSWFR